MAKPDYISDLVWGSAAQYSANTVTPINLVSNNSNLYDLCLMSMCDKHIISNSTFGWWGAWLADSSTVCYPDPWFGSSYINDLHPHFEVMIELKDLFPADWTMVKYIIDKN
jgi:hypothetical protein